MAIVPTSWMLKELLNEIGSEDNCSNVAVLYGFLATESKAKKTHQNQLFLNGANCLSKKFISSKTSPEALVHRMHILPDLCLTESKHTS